MMIATAEHFAANVEPQSRWEKRNVGGANDDTIRSGYVAPGSEIENHGSVRFVRALGDRGTAVRVTLDYHPPAGQAGRWVAKLFGEEPEQQIRDDLRNFKRIMEVGEVLTLTGQSRRTCAGQGRREGD